MSKSTKTILSLVFAAILGLSVYINVAYGSSLSDASNKINDQKDVIAGLEGDKTLLEFLLSEEQDGNSELQDENAGLRDELDELMNENASLQELSEHLPFLQERAARILGRGFSGAFPSANIAGFLNMTSFYTIPGAMSEKFNNGLSVAVPFVLDIVSVAVSGGELSIVVDCYYGDFFLGRSTILYPVSFSLSIAVSRIYQSGYGLNGSMFAALAGIVSPAFYNTTAFDSDGKYLLADRNFLFEGVLITSTPWTNKVILDVQVNVSADIPQAGVVA